MTQETISLIQTVANIATALTFGVAAWQLWESNKQTKKSTIQKRSEYIINLYNMFVNDKDMMDVYYKLEYSNFKYDINFHGSGTEKQLDKLLGHFSNIGRLYFSNILTRSDLKFLEYEFLIIYQNQNIKSYLLFLDTGSKLVELTPKSLITLEKQENYLNKKIRIKSTVSVVTKSILLWIT